MAGEKISQALERLVTACVPIDMWLGGVWAKAPTHDERHEFVLALSEAMTLLAKNSTVDKGADCK